MKSNSLKNIKRREDYKNLPIKICIDCKKEKHIYCKNRCSNCYQVNSKKTRLQPMEKIKNLQKGAKITMENLSMAAEILC